MTDVVVHADAAAFLDRAAGWLERAEDENNLVLGLAAALAAGGTTPGGAPFLATVEQAGDVAGCVLRTPPHKVAVTRLPPGAGPPVAAALADLYERIPAVLGAPEDAWEVARAWVGLRGGRAREGMAQRLHRLDRVSPPQGVAGRMRVVTRGEGGLVAEWARGFVQDTDPGFAPTEAARERWIREGALRFWEDGEPVSMAVATGRTRHGVRIGYVYTPPGRRGRGYATALVATLSQALLDEGFAFCVLYTDLANPTSNRIYARVGYRPVRDLVDVLIEEA